MHDVLERINEAVNEAVCDGLNGPCRIIIRTSERKGDRTRRIKVMVGDDERINVRMQECLCKEYDRRYRPA